MNGLFGSLFKVLKVLFIYFIDLGALLGLGEHILKV